MKIQQVKPTVTEMNRGQICQEFEITLPTLRKVIGMTEEKDRLKDLRVFRGQDLDIVYNLTYWYLVKGRLSYLFDGKSISHQRMNYHIVKV